MSAPPRPAPRPAGAGDIKFCPAGAGGAKFGLAGAEDGYSAPANGMRLNPALRAREMLEFGPLGAQTRIWANPVGVVEA